MSDAAPSERSRPTGFFAIAHKVDDLVFRIEKSIVGFSLVAITVVIFIDVIARRVTAPDSKIGGMLSKIAGIEDLETRDWVDATIAPWVTLGLALFFLGFGTYSARRFARMRAGTTSDVDFKKELGIAAAAAVGGTLLGWGAAQLFEALLSWQVYAGVFALSAVSFAAYQFREKKAGWPLRVGVGLAVGALLVWLSTTYVPEQYTWSKRVSLQLLLWVGLLSASICVYAGKHIRMGAAQKLLPEKARKWVNGTGLLFTAVFCALMTYLGFMYIVAPKASNDEFMMEFVRLGGVRYVYGFEGMIGSGALLEGTDIPAWLGILAAPVGFGIATVRFTGAAISAFLGGSYGEPAAEEGMEEAEKLAQAIGGETAPPEPRSKASDAEEEE